MSRRDDHPPTRDPVPGTRYPVPENRLAHVGNSQPGKHASSRDPGVRKPGDPRVGYRPLRVSLDHVELRGGPARDPASVPVERRRCGRDPRRRTGIGVGSCETARRGGGRRPAEALGFALLRLTIRLWRRTPAACEPSRVIGGCVWIRSRSERGRYRFRGTSDGGRTRHDASVAGTGPPVHPVHRCR